MFNNYNHPVPRRGPAPMFNRGSSQPYQELSDSRSSTPRSSTPSSISRQPTADPFASPSGSITGSHESFTRVVPSPAVGVAATLYGKRANEGSLDPNYAYGPEEDDYLHSPEKETRGTIFTLRGLENLGCLFLMLMTLIMLFGGYPVIITSLAPKLAQTGFNYGGLNSTGQIPNANTFQLIDSDTPASAYKWTSFETGKEWDLVFSDEFNRDGRTFYEGDDPFWAAVDLHYWGTNNEEWYDPRNVFTRDGKLVIEFNHLPSHGLNYTGGMLQSWNKFCFTGGYIEASVSLPGNSKVPGLWPAVWTMGNLGRAGYGGSTDGLWPYTYDSCDTGTLPNQTRKDGTPVLPGGDRWHGNDTSYLPGQLFSRCTCPGDTLHPGPKREDGTWVGRGAPEIDIIEPLVNVDDKENPFGQVSLSGQWAPFNPNYTFINTTKSTQLHDHEHAAQNAYPGGVFQQATSVLATTDPECYTKASGKFARYGFEYANGDDGYITWLSTGRKTWTIRQPAMAPNAEADVGQRLISVEPMYIIINVGMASQFSRPDYVEIAKQLPTEMHVDYIRVYQDPQNRNIGCDPEAFPTAAHIDKYPIAYNNPNITTFDQLAANYPGMSKPRNRLWDDGC